MKLAVVVANFGAAIHVAGGVETTVRTFELPPEAVEYITKQLGANTTVTLALHEEATP